MDMCNDLNFDKLKDDISKLSTTKEKLELIRSVIYDEAAGVTAAFFNPVTKSVMSLDELISAIGEEKTLDLFLQTLSKEASHVVQFSKEEIDDIISRKKSGHVVTQEENAKMQMFLDAISGSHSMLCQHSFLELVVDFIRFSQEDMKYPISLDDILTSISVLSMANMTHVENSFAEKFVYNKESLCDVVITTGEDIYNTWKQTCVSEPEKELVVLGLLAMAAKLSRQCNIKFTDFIALENDLQVNTSELEDEDDEENESEKGSNVTDFAEKSKRMKNMLKE